MRSRKTKNMEEKEEEKKKIKTRDRDRSMIISNNGMIFAEFRNILPEGRLE